MASSEYSEIYSRFYLRIKDYEMSGLDEQLVKNMLTGYLRSTLSKPMVRRLFQSLIIDDDIEEIEYELREPLDEDSDKDFVEEVLALGMTVEWCNPKYQSTLLTSQMFSNSEQKFYSQAAHLAEIRELLNKSQTDLRKLIRDRGYSLSVINGVE